MKSVKLNDQSDLSVEEEHRARVAQVTKAILTKITWEGLVPQPLWFRNPTMRTGLFLGTILFIFGAVVTYHVLLISPVMNPVGALVATASSSQSLPDAATLATALFAALASVFAFLQWQDSRNESSYESFYERLRLVTEQYEGEKGEARSLVAHFWKDSSDQEKFRESLYVFLEIDNLEYMCGRYSLGYIREDLFERAVGTFVSRCMSKEFCTYARRLVRRAGHKENTVKLVDFIVASFA